MNDYHKNSELIPCLRDEMALRFWFCNIDERHVIAIAVGPSEDACDSFKDTCWRDADAALINQNSRKTSVQQACSCLDDATVTSQNVIDLIEYKPVNELIESLMIS